MALTGWSANNYLERLAAVGGTRPFGVYIWVNTGSETGSNRGIWGLMKDPDVLNHSRAGYFTSRQLRANERDTTTREASTGFGASTETWYLCSSIYDSATLREVEISDLALGTSTASATPDAPTRTWIGRRGQATTGTAAHWYNTGGLAEFSVWDLAMPAFRQAANRRALHAALFAGRSPLAVNADSDKPWYGELIAYVPMRDADDLDDLSGWGHHFTMIGTLTAFASHPPVDAPPGAVVPRREPVYSIPRAVARAAHW